MNSINRPNFSEYSPNYEYTYIGDNNLKREFYDCLSIILYSCYEDDTRSSRYYNKMNSDGTSSYYVPQPIIEEELEKNIASPVDTEKYLIGFTGIGKTTLLKNYFKIDNPAPFISADGNLIAYLSAYSELLSDQKQLSNFFITFLSRIVEKLNEKCNFILFDENGKIIQENVDSLYDFFIAQNIVQQGETGDLLSPQKSKIEQLRLLRNEKPLDYFLPLIAYQLSIINQGENPINKIVLIYDDIEAQKASLHIPFITTSQKIAAKLKSIRDRKYVVKTIVALRNYTFRYNYARQADAMRDYSEDVILKKSIPRMKDIFERRFNVYYENEEVQQVIPNEERWKESAELLKKVVNHISDFGDMISSLANYDISHSLKLFLRVLTNHRWFAPDERYYRGAYTLHEEDYLAPLKDRTIKALVYGESSVFIDSDDNVVPNILRYHYEEKTGVELLPLYVMEYMLHLQRSHLVVPYGKQKIVGSELCNEITNILKCNEKHNLIEFIIEQLYLQRCLLQSIYDAEDHSNGTESVSNRKYDSSYGLYLSYRGNKLMEMLEKDSILFEIFRDDIDTELPNNIIPTSEMRQTEKMIYLIKYCEHLFSLEKNFICYADKKLYFRSFGGRFVVARLICGLYNSFNNYYRNEDDDYLEVKEALVKLISNMRNYKSELLNADNSLDINLNYFDSL